MGGWLKALFKQDMKPIDNLESSSEESEEETCVTSEQLVSFLLNNFDLTDYVRGGVHLTKSKTAKRVAHMVEIFVIQGHGIDPTKITQRQLLVAFNQRIEIKLPVAAFFQVGINSSVDIENEQN